MYRLILFFLFYPYNIYANELVQNIDSDYQLKNKLITQTKNNNIITSYYGLKTNARVDYMTKYKKNTILDRKWDRNGDQIYDYWEEYVESASLFKKVSYDNNFDQRIEVLFNFYQDNENQMRVESLNLDEGTKQIGFYSFVQKQCLNFLGADLLTEVDVLALDVKDTYFVMDGRANSFYQTNYGYDIDKECLKGFGFYDFNRFLFETMKTGMQCLVDLDKNSGQQRFKSKAAFNVFLYQELLQNNSVKISCDDFSSNWNDAAAIGSTRSSQRHKANGMDHPFIKLNPFMIKKMTQMNAREKNDLQRSLFHEQFHNLGYVHGHDNEFAYACEQCCFPFGENTGDEVACRLCLGNYSGADDQKYLDDLIDFSRSSSNFLYVTQTFLGQSMAKSQNKKSFTNLIAIHSDYFSPLGSALAILAKKKLQMNNKRIQEALSYEDFIKSNSMSSYETASILAQMYYHMYYEHDFDVVISLLKTHQKKLKDYLEQDFESNPDDSFQVSTVFQDIIEENLRNLLSTFEETKYQTYLWEGQSIKEEAQKVQSYLGL